MRKINIEIARDEARHWHELLLPRLRAAGFAATLVPLDVPAPRSALDGVLRLEARRFGASLASRMAPPADTAAGPADLVIDLSGQTPAPGAVPRLHLTINGQPDLAGGIAAILATGTLPELVLWHDQTPIGVARPMLSDRLWLSRLGDELLAGAVALIEQGVKRHFSGQLVPQHPAPAATGRRHGFLRFYLPHAAAHAAGRLWHKLTRRRPFYWQVFYRPADGADAAFTALDDDGERFYADPFALERDGRTYLFVEEFPYALGRGIISVSERGADGSFSRPRSVLEEPHHLSYPQVFTQGDSVFMLPESGGAGRLVLYRATAFPHDWVADTVLLDGIDINDATLVEHAGRFFLFGTQRIGPGSASDMLVVYGAPALRGPWTPHPLNPIAIDRAGARPGGAIVRTGDRLWLLVQDGTHAYGGGLGRREILQLDDSDVRLGPVEPLDLGPAWRGAGIHTRNHAGGLEFVDSAG